MRRLLTVTLTGMAAVPLTGPAFAADMNVKVEIPRLNVAEYHRPYVAVWVERADQSPAATLAVWYDVKNKEGTKWLKDMRQWWRKAGRDMQMPADGISGATRAPGEHTLTFTEGKAPLGKLPAGNYQLVVEAAREVGGRELLRVPFTWPPQSAQTARAKGEHELGGVTVDLKP
ncbi:MULTISPECIES: DUF2271 domain-containing protein [Cupriavidus]|uniref:Periplasmic protein n=1 Tax=Cupriavidus pinatubonensis (strain JMP 134 / LMG 1197) TaxID=264198 RepID=Q46QM4_CUPPJ|nr:MULTISPECIES: DUF2271 domain-containing protein [Cupriavidus]QYY27804.1 DUF2271 domain-containing protein [Cupriavidus pinatubonensis]